MLTFDVPLLPPGVSAKQAYFTMKSAQRSAAVALVGASTYLVEAGAAFVAWKQDLSFDIARVGVNLEAFDGVYNPPLGIPARPGMLQVQSIEPDKDRVILFSRREVWANRYMTGPAACYCIQCESPGRPVTCEICAGRVDCV
jgi:hypothetical protein